MAKVTGSIYLSGEFHISHCQNHYPSGGEPQRFGANMLLKSDNFTGAISQVQLNFKDYATPLPAPSIFELNGKDCLEVPQPMGAMSTWEYLLTRITAGQYYISYTVNDPTLGSWAFLTPVAATWHKIGI